MADIKAFGENLVGNLEQVIVGKRQSLELAVVGSIVSGAYIDRRCARRRKDHARAQPCEIS